MARRDFKSVDEYIASQPEVVRRTLKRVRGAIRGALPKAQELISYKMPTYRLYGSRMLYFATWKQHYSIYGATERVLAEFRDELAPYQVAKGSIRFPLAEPVPAKLIAGIAKFRAKLAAERENAATGKSKKGQ